MPDNNAIHKFKAGDKFHDRYTLEKLIGVGGFADVWKAVDETTHSTIALKIYTNLDDDGYNDLSEEYTRMQNLNHTNILKADHFDRWGNIPYLVMKYCSGGSLNKKIGKLEDTELLHIIKDIAEGLKYLHQNKIVHQDIKPANILIDEQSGVVNYVLSDFGISSKTKTKLSHSVNLLNKGTSMTEDYAPPEKFSKNKEDRRPDRKGDIFSFGISLFELATGGLPFDEMPTGRQLHYGDAEIDFSEIKNEKIKRIVSLCMQPDKDARPSAEDILKLVQSDKIPEAPSVKGMGRRTVKKQDVGSDVVDNNFKKWILPLLAIVAVSLVAYFVISLSSGSDVPPPVVPPEETSIPQEAKVETFTINGISFDMVLIPGGDFQMGCTDPNDANADEDEKPIRDRHVSDFYMGKHEVTQQLWFVIMNENPSKTVNDNFPVNNISWDDCQLFIQRLNSITGRNFRLPTETEWEYAAKAHLNDRGKLLSSPYKYAGTNTDLTSYAWYSANSNGNIHTVGTKKPNNFGLYDMSGNVIEWCQDIYTNYSTGYPIIDKDQRVLRGGYFDGDAGSVRCTSRGSSNYKTRMAPFGFRLCLQ
jgi:formylglycine-generating enzyme required for sulfatase activity